MNLGIVLSDQRRAKESEPFLRRAVEISMRYCREVS